ncbi:MAG TPA: SPOR domain-containing protein [Marinobacter sp.]|uniref:SPOR domain-containing protein n=1 Tax=Marinobacter sp. TaxID=50741 RepID=UPI00261DD4BF|nr:SPOR domain-containing protein [Marinobacter sp.]HET8801383.1 SPOR domain-containing protein [Marinobacter sp.]
MDGLKQRIIGALVLVSLAVIFVPMVFDEPHSERTSTTIKIPEEPPFPEVNVPEGDRAQPPTYENSGSAVDPEATQTSRPLVDSQDYRIVEEGDSAGGTDASGTGDGAKADQPAEPVEGQAAEPKVAEPEPSEAPTTTASASDSGEPVESAEYTRSLEGAWVVQLGSFGNEDNARRLRDQVRDKGYDSHLQQVVRGGTTLTRVFSGPFASESEAQTAKQALDKTFNLNSLVTTGEK